MRRINNMKKKIEIKEENKIIRNITWTFLGIVLMIVMVGAATTITDSSISTTGDGLIEGNLRVLQNINVSFNLTVLSYLFLDNDYELPPGQNKILRRNSASKAVFGIQNLNAEASIDSGAGYVINTSVGEYRLDLHSAADTRNPNETVHHLIGANLNEIWRLNPTVNSEFRFEQSLDNSTFVMNRTGLFIPGLRGNGMCTLNITNSGQIIIGGCT